MSKPVVIGGVVAITLAIALSAWWITRPSEVEVDLTLQFASHNGCGVVHPDYGSVYGQLDVVIRDSSLKKLETVRVFDSAATTESTCHMVGIGTLEERDAYRVFIESYGESYDAGIVDWSQVERGHITLVDP